MDDSDRLIEQLTKIAEQDAVGKKSEARLSVYIIEIEKLDPDLKFEFYVGSTGNSVRYRFEQHIPGHKFAAKIFRKSRATAKCLRWDMMIDFPKFHSKEAAERAEGLVAKALSKAGWSVHSDRLEKD